MHESPAQQARPEYRAGTEPAPQSGIPTAEQLSGLLQQLKIRPTDEGGVSIDAPAAAAALAALFGGIAERLQSGS